jgi:hypothetical protein
LRRICTKVHEDGGARAFSTRGPNVSFSSRVGSREERRKLPAATEFPSWRIFAVLTHEGNTLRDEYATSPSRRRRRRRRHRSDSAGWGG